MFPAWLHLLAIASLVVAGACALLIAFDETRRAQKMWIMYLVWPLTALFGGLLWLWLYWQHGRGPAPGSDDAGGETPMRIAVAKGASHCGAGCTLGDIVAEWLAFALPGIAVAFGWGSLFAEKTFAVWVFDYLLAFAIGIVFQYFTIKPMRDLSVAGGIKAAVKADFLSITSWQVGMYGVMALLQFAWLRPSFGQIAPVNSPEFWFVMQLAMVAGFVTAYPVNWWLVHAGFKEKM
ncbi:protein of unknown function [Sphingomonas palmae]|uniref:DUF4396 domain-containing protein n=1 Tax=Sphingomonas palmae TaxID=1855283 RepID=A0A1H7LQE7_9SPHN|nr:DUF4396 domain-containing protein [Sphingomonas palmae]SEL01126.1 protein of unknown function [Sphingomonas palmae]